jgi:vacuolar protein sorting-associated protein 41
MAEGEGSKEPDVSDTTPSINGDPPNATTASTADEEDGGEEDEEEPRLKYATVTKRLSSLFRNGDAVSAFLVAGDKMVRYVPQKDVAHQEISLTGSL